MADNPASYAYLRIFGHLAYFHVNDSKLESRARKAIFLVMGKGVKG